MKWLEIAVAVDQEAVEPVAAIFHEHGQGGVSIEESITTFDDPDRYIVNRDQPVQVRTYLPTGRGARARMWIVDEMRGALALQNPEQQAAAPSRTESQDLPEVLTGCGSVRDGAERCETMPDPKYPRQDSNL